MLKITFKNVGQGDSIILEWLEQTQQTQPKKCIGIIDCKLYQGENPVLLHVIEENYQEIDFLLLSHPHDDHFSGFLGLIQYCETNHIKIKKFYHTSIQVPDFLKVACKSITSGKDIADLFRKLKDDDKKNKYDLQYINAFSSSIELGNTFKITCLSPSSKEENDYPNSNNENYYDTDNDANNPKANLLSTVLKITDKNSEIENPFVLLTSDAPKKVLERLGKREAESLKGLLLLGQSPHHGAKNNHYNAFWKNLVVKRGCFAVFSVGVNQYKHPSEEAIDFFADNNFQTRFTSKIGISSKIISKITPLQVIKNKLDDINTISIDDGKDCIFEFENRVITEK